MAVNSPIHRLRGGLDQNRYDQRPQEAAGSTAHAKMILQVHDELIFEVPERELDEAKRLVKHEMEAVGKQLGLSVPLKVDLGVGKNWRAAHP
jgi:DNA polymerase-1